ncbi:MAG: ATP-binding protein [Burkholderiaceae bacterium]
MNIVDIPPILANTLIKQLLPRGESRQLEFKRVSGKMVGKALETVCAFANTAGGMLVLGLADLKEFQGPARLFGVEENAEAVDELQRKLQTEFLPGIDGLKLRRISCVLNNGPSKDEQAMSDAACAAQPACALHCQRWHLPPAGCRQPHDECQ